MSQKPTLRFRDDSADHLIKKYLKLTIIQFDKDMGKRLAEVREQMGVSQKQLADQLGLSQTVISRLEAGKKVNSLPRADVFKTVLDKYFDYVLFSGFLMRQTELSISNEKYLGKWWAKLK